MLINKADLQYLRGLVEQARLPAPVGWQPWYLQGFDQVLGLLPPERAATLSLAMPKCMPLIPTARGWVWHAESFTAAERSQVLQAISLDFFFKKVNCTDGAMKAMLVGAGLKMIGLILLQNCFA